ncbi:RNA recognition domain-containing protein [Lineolata rhizophorae]|uniref:RNA recognition domain-containing protein n=1 Tax=Lineolata rhizophorae TaxID=578093 RepID=A0A6A6PAF0_9PEZI|nr:RNA recognition domain-containing protein [Lineolata rhizophorae]
MSGKLDQSLDDILKDRRQSRPRRNRPARVAKTAATAPVGGIKKASKLAKQVSKTNVPTGPSSGSGEGKIIISNMPEDVDEKQINEYMKRTIGPVKRVQITYGPNGRSRGIVTVVFPQAHLVHEAMEKINGVRVDGRPLKVEVILGGNAIPPPAPAKSLTERISTGTTQNAKKAQPKPATAGPKPANAKDNKAGKKRQRGRNAGRGKPKSAAELDAEMADYFDAGTNGNTTGGDAPMGNGNGGAQAATNGSEAIMSDEIM